jgi:hypothetical protein
MNEEPSLLLPGHQPRFDLLQRPECEDVALATAWNGLKDAECNLLPSGSIGDVLQLRLQALPAVVTAEALLDLPAYAQQGFVLRKGAVAAAEELTAKLNADRSAARFTDLEVCLLLQLRQTPGSSSNCPPSLCLHELLWSVCALHNFELDKYREYVDARKAGLKPKGEPSLLTVAGRALSKHAQRDSSARFWGRATGSKAHLNTLANQVISRVLAGAVWFNVHALPHDIQALEVRQKDGFGCRWVLNPRIAFRGFLEPHVEDGHANGWHHA